jgi:hypothetical protein
MVQNLCLAKQLAPDSYRDLQLANCKLHTANLKKKPVKNK